MSITIEYHENVVKIDIPKLDETTKKRIKQAIEDKLIHNPHIYGKPLRRSMKGYWKLRVEDYRVIFTIQPSSVKIFVIQHRTVVYEKGLKRIR